MPKIPHEISHESHIHIGNRWYEKPLFVGLCFAVIIVVCIAIGENTSTSPRTAGASGVTTTDETPPVRVAAIGDSNTDGTGVDEAERATLSYPAQLQSMLGSRYEVTNFGVSGSTLITGTNNPYPDHEFFKNSKDANPNVVLIMLGTNDFRSEVWNVDDYKNQFVTFINQYKNLPTHPKIYILTPPGYFKETDEHGTAVLRDEVVPAVFAIAEKTETEVIDIYAATKNHGDVFPDGVHLNADGYKIIAQTIYDKLMQ